MNPSQYNIVVKYKSKVLMYNALNHNFAFLTDDGNTEQKLDEFLYHNAYAKEAGFVIEEDFDEETAFLMNLQDKQQSRFLRLVILPTMQCNFACPYCYENKRGETMQPGVVEAIEKFLSFHLYEYAGLHISWFGGEPLLRMDVIETVNKKAMEISRKLGKVFFSSITTNGYLLSGERADRLFACNVRDFTVTLDGTQAYHDQYRKLRNGNGTYAVLIQNILEMKQSEKSFHFTIRMNVNRENEKSLQPFIDEMYRFVGSDRRFDIALVLTADWGGETVGEMKDELLRSTESLYNIAIQNKDKFHFNNLFQILNGDTCNFANRHTYVVDTKGNLLKCTVYLDHDKAVVGRILPDGSLQMNYSNLGYWNLHHYEATGCKGCKIALTCKGRQCPAVADYRQRCGYSVDKLNKMIIAKYELNPASFYCMGGGL